MSAVTNIWRQLVQRRLWPVAIILIAALVAVPLTMAKDPEPPPPVEPAQVDTKSELAITPIVAQATAADRTKRRKVLGARKNPFAVPKATAAETTGPGTSDGPDQGGADAGGQTSPDTTSTTGGGMPAGVGGSPVTGGGVTTPPAVEPTPAPAPKRHSMHELTVRFGGEEDMSRMSIERLEAVPVGEEPLVVYLGVADHGKSAVFLIDSSVKADGDGECRPDPNTCEKIHVREGETEFFDVVDENGESVASYQLDLLEIHEGKSASAAKSAKASKAVRRVLRAAAPGALQDRAETAGVARTADAGLGLALPLP